MRILIMGLPGSGKTHLALRLQHWLDDCAWFNADAIRKMANDWDFSDAGRRRQAERMNSIATFEGTRGRTVICDFVCPTNETRKLFGHEIMIWMNTIEEGQRVFIRQLQLLIGIKLKIIWNYKINFIYYNAFTKIYLGLRT